MNSETETNETESLRNELEDSKAVIEKLNVIIDELLIEKGQLMQALEDSQTRN